MRHFNSEIALHFFKINVILHSTIEVYAYMLNLYVDQCFVLLEELDNLSTQYLLDIMIMYI